MRNRLIDVIEKPQVKEGMPNFAVGDTVDVHTRIVEGDKTRTQVFSGTVISLTGKGLTQTFTVRRIVTNEGVERIFPVHSPNVEKVVVKRSGRVRRSKLNYLRTRVGKATRLAEKTKKVEESTAEASA